MRRGGATCQQRGAWPTETQKNGAKSLITIMKLHLFLKPESFNWYTQLPLVKLT